MSVLFETLRNLVVPVQVREPDTLALRRERAALARSLRLHGYASFFNVFGAPAIYLDKSGREVNPIEMPVQLQSIVREIGEINARIHRAS